MNIERESLVLVDKVIDQVLVNGGQYLYEQYLKPKVRPYTARGVCMISTVAPEVSFYRD